MSSYIWLLWRWTTTGTYPQPSTSLFLCARMPAGPSRLGRWVVVEIILCRVLVVGIRQWWWRVTGYVCICIRFINTYSRKKNSIVSYNNNMLCVISTIAAPHSARSIRGRYIWWRRRRRRRRGWVQEDGDRRQEYNMRWALFIYTEEVHRKKKKNWLQQERQHCQPSHISRPWSRAEQPGSR